jgi:predicted nucleic acid-binding protein
MYPRLRNRISATDAEGFVTLLRRGAILATDPREAPRRSAEPGDDYLVGLAESERAILVSGDQHVLALADQLPIQTARMFLESFGTASHG